jgi:hypothetical protein
MGFNFNLSSCPAYFFCDLVNIQDDFSRVGILIMVPDSISITSVYHLLFNAMLQYGNLQIIRFDTGPASSRETFVQCLQGGIERRRLGSLS